MAGNIIPAIATTNAVIAGLIVMEGLKVLMGNINDCRTVSNVLFFEISLFSSRYRLIIPGTNTYMYL